MDGGILNEIPTEDFTIETEIINASKYVEDVYLMTVLYTNNGQLLKVCRHKIEDDLKSFSEEICEHAGDVAEIKTFIWDSNMTSVEYCISIK